MTIEEESEKVREDDEETMKKKSTLELLEDGDLELEHLLGRRGILELHREELVRALVPR